MNIGPHTFQEFKNMAAAFHGYPAPGLLAGGYMMALAQSRLPEGVLYEAVVETPKCLPDAVQLLSPLSTGNNWMKVVNLGRYALTLYDKRTGEGWRVWLDPAKLADYPEYRAWLLKLKPKSEQDSDQLFLEIETAGDTVCSLAPARVPERLRRKAGMGRVDICPICGEAYPVRDGAICRGCQGEAPATLTLDGPPALSGPEAVSSSPSSPPLVAVPVEEAVGGRALHDMTRVAPGESKGPEFKAGQVIGAGDLCRLHQMGRMRVYTEDQALPGDEWVHENEAARIFAARMAGEGVTWADPSEGKITFRAETDGLLVLDREALTRFNLCPDVMCATRQGESVVQAGKPLAACRAIPLYISRPLFSRALAALGDGPLLTVVPLRRARVGVLVTGTEVFQGLIEDRFVPIVTQKVEALGSEVTASAVAPDERGHIVRAVRALLEGGCDFIVTTAGLSVDPDDVTRPALVEAGLTDVLYGAPVLPGAMTLVGRIGDVPVLGVPACALFHKTTSMDLLLPRLLAGIIPTRADLARLGEGSLCLDCRNCTYPKCPFGK